MALGFVASASGRRRLLRRGGEAATARRPRAAFALRAVVENSNAPAKSAVRPPSTAMPKRLVDDAHTAYRRRPQAPLPEGTRMGDVVRSLPKEVFQLDARRAWLHVLVTAVSVPLTLLAVHVSPWYLLPFTWFLAGTAATGLFVIGHDAGHGSFSRNALLNDVVGNACMAPLLYPFEPWRVQHNVHHRNTNMLQEEGAGVADNAWQPLPLAFVRRTPRPLMLGVKVVWQSVWYLLSVFHWLYYHFDLRPYASAAARRRVVVSWLCCAGFAAAALPALCSLGGAWAVAKLWLMPWLGFHFWMSTFTLIHHTAPHIEFKPKAQWDAATQQLSGTVHCDFPRWIELLTHDINVHIPHHISTAIPSYNLKAAHAALRERWAPYLNETEFSWALCREVVKHCQVYADGQYITYEEAIRRVDAAAAAAASQPPPTARRSRDVPPVAPT